MNTGIERSVVIVEDDPHWQEIYKDSCRRQGWKSTVFGNIPVAIRALESEDYRFDIAIVDTGDNNPSSTQRKIDFRDGFTFLRTIKELQPSCIRVLSTGAGVTNTLLRDPTLGIHIFMDVAYYADFQDEMFHELNKWNTAPTLESPIVFTSARRRERLG